MRSRPWPPTPDPTSLEPVATNPKNEAVLRRALQQLNALVESFNAALEDISENTEDIVTNAAGVAAIEADYLDSSYTGTESIDTLGTITTGTWQGSTIGDGYLTEDYTTAAELAAWTGSANITTLGTIGTGTWQGTVIDHERGGLEDDVSAYDGLVKISGGSTSEVAIGIDDTNVPPIDAGGVGNNDYAKFTAGGLEGRTYAEVKEDLSLNNVENTAVSTWAGSTNITTLGTIGTGTWQGTVIDHERGGLEADVSAYSGLVKISGGSTSAVTIGIGDGNVCLIDGAGVADNDYAKFTASGLEGRSYSEVRDDLSLDTDDSVHFSDVEADFIFPTSDSTTAFSVRKANGTTHVITVDTTNGWVGIGVTPTAALDVDGPIRMR